MTTSTTQPNQLSLVKPKVNEPLVSHLEKILEHAKTGELQASFEVCLWGDGYTSHGWAQHEDVIGMGIIGEIELMKKELLDKYE